MSTAELAPLKSCCCNDVLDNILGRLEPREVISLSLSDRALHTACSSRCQYTALARYCGRVQLRRVRTTLEQRSLFVGRVCCPVPAPKKCLPRVLSDLESSPDGIRDLSAAVQKVMERVASQNDVAPIWLERVHQDCVNLASFVCLLAWKAHMRSRRTESVEVVAMEQQEGGSNAPSTSTARRSSEQSTATAATTPSGSSSSSMRTSSSDEDTDAGSRLASITSRQSSQGTQADLSGSLRDIQELLSGFRALATSPNPSIKPCTATLQLLAWYLQLELQAWYNPALAAAEEAVAEVVEQAAAAAAAALEAEEPGDQVAFAL